MTNSVIAPLRSRTFSFQCRYDKNNAHFFHFQLVRIVSRDSSVSIGYGIDNRGSISGGRNDWIFFSSPLPPDRIWCPPSLISNGYGGRSSSNEKRPRSETNHSSPSSVGVKNARSYTSSTQYVLMAWCLDKHRGNIKDREGCGITVSPQMAFESIGQYS
jgi:hypothetical protein